VHGRTLVVEQAHSCTQHAADARGDADSPAPAAFHHIRRQMHG